MMKKIYTLLSFLTLLGLSNVYAQALYLNNAQNTGRFNPGLGARGAPVITFDDINIANADIADADSVALTNLKVGIRQIAGAPAVTVSVYITGIDPASVFEDSLPAIPPTLIGTFDLTANTGTVGRTVVLSVGDSVNAFTTLVRDTSNLFGGFQTFFVGVSFSDEDDGNGWRTTDGPSANADVFWIYDEDEATTPRTANGLTSGKASFYSELYGKLKYLPAANDAKISDIITPDQITCLSGPQTMTVVVQNMGDNIIPIGAATVTLKVAGANTYSRTISNTTPIPFGGTVNINFSDVDLTNPGVNFDTAYVNYAPDQRHSNDTLSTGTITAETIASFPAIDGAETNFPVLSFAQPIIGGQLWRVQSDSAYINGDMVDSLDAHSGQNFFYFDSYSSPDSYGVVSRLFTNCITLTRSVTGTSNNMTFWMSHDTTLASLGDVDDSLYVSVSADKGVTWTRIAGFARLDPAFAVPGWKQENIDLSAYGCQTIQIGFEGASHYGNIIGIDDVTINSTGDLNCVANTTVNWTGNVSTAWEDAGNWSNNAVPASTSNVVIPTGRPRYPVVNTNTTIKSVTCAPGTSVNVAAGVVLSILK